jgi:8-amino-7-oxononanoate synthase
MNLLDHYAQQLEDLKLSGNFRQFKSIHQHHHSVEFEQQKMFNLSSNDYLGLATNIELREEFFDLDSSRNRRMSASSSRLLTGNFPEYEKLEQQMSQLFNGKAVLLFNSGYHMNIGILPAVTDDKTLILSDKLVHASIIDGIRLGKAKFLRYRHNDLSHLKQLIEQYQNDGFYQRIIVVTESIFSMDGDETDLTALVELKKQYKNVMLYVDEAHAIGVRGERGLGCAEQYGVIDDIDFLVGTFGKALASVGGYLVCHPILRDYLINKMRPLIFSTAQPPINMAWTGFILSKTIHMQTQRKQLHHLSHQLQQAIIERGFESPSTTQIIPVILGDSQHALNRAEDLQKSGFYILPVRPPTVPQGSSRLRICMNTLLNQNELDRLIALL